MTMTPLFAKTHGVGPACLLLHGLGGTGDVWERMLPDILRDWPGRVIVPDLRGHGRSPEATPYGIGTLAADVAGLFAQDEEVTILGHSMGGAVGLALATGLFGIRVRRIASFGMKISWDPAEVAAIHALAAKPKKVFAERSAAIERYLLVSGLAGHVAPDTLAAASGVAACEGGYCLAMDPRANGVAGQSVVSLIPDIATPRLILGGEADPMVPVNDLFRIAQHPVVLPRCGHNPHVEAPQLLWQNCAGFLLAATPGA